jgi:predicted peptidase
MRASILLSLWLSACTLPAAEKLDENLLNLFEARVQRDSSGLSIPYRLFKPRQYDPARKYPLVLFLHGAVGAGTDNRMQFNGGNEVPAKALTAPENQAKYPCLIIAPQCPPHDRWANTYGNQPTGPMRATLAALASLQKEFSIDADRVYVIGLSAGGHGVWDVISRNPRMFAAAVPICSAGNVEKAPLLIHIPIWCFHGTADPLVDVKYAREMIAAITKAGGHPKYTEYPGVGHNSYVNAFKEPDLLPWIFEQKRGVTPSSK